MLGALTSPSFGVRNAAGLVFVRPSCLFSPKRSLAKRTSIGVRQPGLRSITYQRSAPLDCGVLGSEERASAGVKASAVRLFWLYYSGTLNETPAEIRVIFNKFLPGSAQGYAIGAFIGLHGQRRI